MQIRIGEALIITANSQWWNTPNQILRHQTWDSCTLPGFHHLVLWCRHLFVGAAASFKHACKILLILIRNWQKHNKKSVANDESGNSRWWILLLISAQFTWSHNQTVVLHKSENPSWSNITKNRIKCLILFEHGWGNAGLKHKNEVKLTSLYTARTTKTLSFIFFKILQVHSPHTHK